MKKIISLEIINKIDSILAEKKNNKKRKILTK